MNSILTDEELLHLLVLRFNENICTKSSDQPQGNLYHGVISILKDFLEVYSDGELEVRNKVRLKLFLEDLV